MSSQSAPECTLQSLSYNTDTASSILLTLDCSDNICGCHLLHSLCNHPFYKPLHPPSPSALPPSSPTFGEGKGGVVPCTRGILEFCSRGSCTCVFAKCTRMYDTIPRDYTSVASDILQTLNCSDNICGCHLLHSLCNHPFDKPLHPPEPSALPPSSPTFGEGKGEAYTVFTGETRFLIQGQLHLCLRKVHPNVRHNPS